MDAKELAAKLNGREYCREITDEEVRQAKEAGLVVVFGASDDLIEFRGAIRDEGDCYDGREVLIDAKGVLPSWDSASESEESAQEYFELGLFDDDVQQFALRQMLGEGFGTLAPQTGVKPLRGPVAIIALAAVVDCQRKGCNGFAAGGLPEGGVFAQTGECGKDHCCFFL